MARRLVLTLLVVVVGFGIGMVGTATILGVPLPYEDPGSYNFSVPNIDVPGGDGNETVVSPTPTPGGSTGTPDTTEETTEAPGTTTRVTPEEQSSQCEQCHPNADRETPHKQLGNSCRTCHPKTVHVIHDPAPIECEECHGSGAGLSIPQPPKRGKPVCTACHADNVVTLHIEDRGRECYICHGDDIEVIHDQPVGS